MSSKKAPLTAPAPSSRGEGAFAEASTYIVKSESPRKGSAGKAIACKGLEESARKLAKYVQEDFFDWYGLCENLIVVVYEDGDSEEDVRLLTAKLNRLFSWVGVENRKLAVGGTRLASLLSHVISAAVYGVILGDAKISSFSRNFLGVARVKCNAGGKTISQTTLTAKILREKIVRDEL